jgi:membrane-associated phospholipid phosphatase
MGKAGDRLWAAALRLRAADAFCILMLVLFSLTAWLAPHRPPNWWLLVLGNLAGIGWVVLFRWLSVRSRRPAAQMIFGMCLLVLFIWSWGEVGRLQLAIRGRWLDAHLVGLEHRVFGVHVSLWLERFVSVPVTEWMMLGYFSYLPLIPLVAAVLFLAVRPQAMDSYLLAIAVAYGTCYVGFLVFPLIGPMVTFADQYTVPLEGYVGRFLTRLMEDYGMFPGGCLPSAHCGAGAVMLFVAFKHHRKTFWIILPAIVTFFAATVYGRYHYVSDTVTGIAVGFIAGWLAPSLEGLWDRLPGRVAAAVPQRAAGAAE